MSTLYTIKMLCKYFSLKCVPFTCIHTWLLQGQGMNLMVVIEKCLIKSLPKSTPKFDCVIFHGYQIRCQNCTLLLKNAKVKVE